MNSRTAAQLFILCGPTAIGREAVVGSLCGRYPSQFYPSISVITCQSRPGEVGSKSYFFVSHEEFQGLIGPGGMSEWAEVHQQNLYGTPVKPMDEALAWGSPVLLEIDLDDFRQVRAVRPKAHSIFLLSPSWRELKWRLIGCGMESTEEQHHRSETVRVELAAQNEFGELIINNNLADAVSALAKSMGLA